MGRVLRWLIVVPLAAVLILAAYANRHKVLVVLDPFRPQAPALSFDVPLYIVLFVALGVGVLLGGMAVWVSQGRYRRAARRAAVEAHRREVEARRTAAAQPAGRYTALPARRSA